MFPDPVAISYGGSGTIARQITQGAPADVVILANPIWMDWLEDHDAILDETRFDMATNRLVLVGAKSSAALLSMDGATLLSALNGGRLAMGQRDAVPAGIYAREWLIHIGAWDMMAPHLAETENVRAALALVARGETPLGVVYATDALAEGNVNVVWNIPEAAHRDIRYPAAAVTSAGAAFAAFLKSDAARKIFYSKGFLPARDPQ